jgi:hypothetical protein
MREIYIKASKVIAYFGESSTDSGMALNFMKEGITNSLISGNIAAINERDPRAPIHETISVQDLDYARNSPR